MRRLVTGKQMKEIDAYAIQTIGILSMVLMERAALAVADELMQEYQRRGRKPVLDARVLVFCGTGNNGADGAAIARILHLRGISVSIITVGDRSRWTGEMERQISIDEKLGIAIEDFGGYLPGRFDVACGKKRIAGRYRANSNKKHYSSHSARKRRAWNPLCYPHT